MKYVVWALVLLLIMLHQDNWFWSDSTLLFGWAPVTLVYQAGLSLASAVVWFLATRFCWPRLDETPAAAAASGQSH